MASLWMICIFLNWSVEVSCKSHRLFFHPYLIMCIKNTHSSLMVHFVEVKGLKEQVTLLQNCVFVPLDLHTGLHVQCSHIFMSGHALYPYFMISKDNRNSNLRHLKLTEFCEERGCNILEKTQKKYSFLAIVSTLFTALLKWCREEFNFEGQSATLFHVHQYQAHPLLVEGVNDIGTSLTKCWYSQVINKAKLIKYP